ncbi:uncharacterized protein LOC112523038 isoform X2 [Cynara cardunculus var. scolymus]|uniref:uncharacterized protein LOC112523038 isoform X2 n=1 Tax=Cynara cardunculus var. scolymus TaxID=59895 RepID=UPI000D627BB9|nr:uncharacterized protein LOC112523038 isoform X2 [Cynara cardunculus var. scolymus]
MVEKSKSKSDSTMPSSKFTTQFNLSKCTLNNGNSLEVAGDTELNFWPPSTAVVDRLILELKAKDGDTEANWEKIMVDFKKELDAEEQFKPPLLVSDVINNSGGGDDGMEKGVSARAKFSVPLSRREMEKDFEDMGERRLPRKPKKRPKSLQNQLDTLFPGLWLTEINADLYRVSDTKKFIGA